MELNVVIVINYFLPKKTRDNGILPLAWRKKGQENRAGGSVHARKTMHRAMTARIGDHAVLAMGRGCATHFIAVCFFRYNRLLQSVVTISPPGPFFAPLSLPGSLDSCRQHDLSLFEILAGHQRPRRERMGYFLPSPPCHSSVSLSSDGSYGEHLLCL